MPNIETHVNGHGPLTGWYVNGHEIICAYMNGVVVFSKTLYLTLPCNPNSTELNLRDFIDSKAPKDSNGKLIHCHFVVTLNPSNHNNSSCHHPTIRTGNLTNLAVTLIINGSLEAGRPEHTAALEVNGNITLKNNGWIRAYGGEGGLGGKGGTGPSGTATTTKLETRYTFKGCNRSNGDGSYAVGWNANHYPYDQSYAWNGYGGWKTMPSCGPYTGWVNAFGGMPSGRYRLVKPQKYCTTCAFDTPPGSGANITYLDSRIFAIEREYKVSTATTGGAGGAGGAGGKGQYYKHPATNGKSGSLGAPGTQPETTRGCRGGTGGRGGTWGNTGNTGARGDCNGLSGKVGKPGGIAIQGKSNISGTGYGNTYGSVI